MWYPIRTNRNNHYTQPFITTMLLLSFVSTADCAAAATFPQTKYRHHSRLIHHRCRRRHHHFQHHCSRPHRHCVHRHHRRLRRHHCGVSLAGCLRPIQKTFCLFQFVCRSLFLPSSFRPSLSLSLSRVRFKSRYA